ncbi:hypothetical protein, conserved [Eimeria praecox]|uniref:Uncharacterized protein n=1 Tax=Eimeria praecox TaxID=51316 RepID=U6G6G2_9EIME|nr:hypothetical protein, conserved [Eimeria praecox]
MHDANTAQRVESRKELRAAVVQEKEAKTHINGGRVAPFPKENNSDQQSDHQEADEAVDSLAEYLRWIDEAEADLEDLRVEAFIERGLWCQIEGDILHKQIALLSESVNSLGKEDVLTP